MMPSASKANLLFFAFALLASLASAIYRPEQVHISLTKEPTEMAVTWITAGPTKASSATFFPTKTPAAAATVEGEASSFKGVHGNDQFLHRAIFTRLKAGESYTYRVVEDGEASQYFTFRMPAHSSPLKVVVFGDLGVFSGVSMPALLRLAEEPGSVDLILHIGDIAYDLFNQVIGDLFMTSMEPLIATVPYMVIPGNHEEEKGHNFTTYRNMFTMPDRDVGDNHFYSFDFGPIHFVAVSSELYEYSSHYGPESARAMYNWLQKDLEEYTARRSSHPWLIAYQHRPLYCSERSTHACTSGEIQKLLNGFKDVPGLAPLYESAAADIVFAGHEHHYERFFPRNHTTEKVVDPYHDADGCTYIVSGAAGCHGSISRFADEPAPFSAVRLRHYGYTLLTVHDASRIDLEQIDTQHGSQVVDSASFSKSAKKIESYDSEEVVQQRYHALREAAKRTTHDDI